MYVNVWSILLYGRLAYKLTPELMSKCVHIKQQRN